jgi:hypothetical protein
VILLGPLLDMDVDVEASSLSSTVTSSSVKPGCESVRLWIFTGMVPLFRMSNHRVQ